MFTRERGEDVSFRDVKIKTPNRTWVCEWRHAPEACVEDLGKFEKVSSWELDSEREGSTFGTRWGQTNLCATGVARVLGEDGKVIIERLCTSLPYVETFNSKVIKGFVPELRSRYVFFVSRDSYVLYVMNILCTFHTYPYHGYGTRLLNEKKKQNEGWKLSENLYNIKQIQYSPTP